MSTENQLSTECRSVKDYLALPAYRDRFHEVMGKRANQFMAAIVASSQLPGLKDAEPRSIIAAAMVAATLDLPVNPTLGQAHIVAYSDGQQKVAQFQIGYKGLIQLALRSGQYKRLNAGPVSEGAFKGFDMVGEPILDFTKNDPTKDAAGYYCAFETLNGFLKVVYFSKEQAEAHAKRFSRAYAKGYSTPWKSDFDSMATKTVIKAALGKWGLLSVEMQKAVVHDQGAQADVDADVKYVDGGEDKNAEDAVPGDPAPIRPEPPKRNARGAAKVRENVQEGQIEEQAPIPEAAKVGDPEPKGAAKVEEPKAVEPVKEAPPAEPVKEAPVESFAQAAEATAPSALTNIVAGEGQANPRTSLNDGEEITVECVAHQVTGMNRTKGGVVIEQMVQVELRGGFQGTAYHLGGAHLQGSNIVPNAPWANGAKVWVTLRGRKNTAQPAKVQIFVQKVEAVPEEGEI